MQQMKRPVSLFRCLLAAGALVVLAAMGVPGAGAQGALDDSTAWQRLGDARQEVSALGFSGDRDAPTVWAGDSGIFRLDSVNGTWLRIAVLPSHSPFLFLNDPFDSFEPDTVFLAGGRLSRSVDSGETFTLIQSPAGGHDGLISPQGALGRFSSDSPYSHRLVSGDWPSVVYSDDGGDSWTRTDASPTHESFRLHAFRSGRVLSVGFYGAALSRDGGQTFAAVPALYDTTRIGFDLTELVMLDGFVTGQPGDSEEGRVLVFGTQAGRPGTHVWASDDEGDTWAEIHAFEYGGIWSVATAVPEAEAGAPGWAVAVEPSPGRVFATIDGGETWVRIGRVPNVGEGSDGTLTRARAGEIGPDGRLYVGTTRTGPKESWSYRSRARVAEVIRFATAGEESSPEAVPGFTLTIHPNPAGSHTEVVLRLGAGARPTEAAVTVHDAQGREVAHLGGAVAGERVFLLDTSGLASGVYVVRAATGTEAATAAFTIAR